MKPSTIPTRDPEAVAGRIEARLAVTHPQVEVLKRRQAQTAAELGALPPTVLDRVFAGYLVPQYPAAEPASGLLGCFTMQSEVTW